MYVFKETLQYFNLCISKTFLKAPGNKFDKGYNKALGDSGILLKTGHKRETLPRLERQWVTIH